MNFKETSEFLSRIISVVDKYDDTAREIISSILPVIPEPYKSAILFVMNTEKKAVAFLVDLVSDIENSGLKKEEKLKEAIKRCEGRTEGGLGDKNIAEMMISSTVGIFDSIVKKIKG